MEISRRNLCALIPALALLGPVSRAAEAADQQAFETLSNSQVFPFDKLPEHRSPNGVETRHVLRGKLATGEVVEVHETLLPPGLMPHRPHHHLHSEMWLVREGTVELTVAGRSQRVGPGSVGFAASNQEHGIRNVGDGPAQYFVVAIGPTA